MMWRRIGGAALAVAVLAGCAAIPSSGPVTEVVDDRSLQQSTVRYQPALPADGASPTDIVRGFLDAMLAYPSSTQTATAFLTPDAARSWRPQDGVVIYDGPRVSETGDGSRVSVTLDEVGRLTAAGRYSTGSGGRAVSIDLEQVDGQWRVNNPPNGLLVTSKFFDDYFRAFNVYYFDHPAKRLVPVPVHLPVDDRLAAALVGSLEAGPGKDQPHLQSFLPRADALRPTVPVVDGVAEVGFTGVDRGELNEDLLSAQIVRTLAQVPSLTGVSIAVDDHVLSPTGSEVQPVSAWDVYDTDRARDRAFGLRSGRVVRIVDNEVSPLAGVWGTEVQKRVRAVAVSTKAIALLDRDRRQLEIADIDGRARASIAGIRMLDPIVDADGRFWVVDRPNGRTRIRVVNAEGEARVIDSGDLVRRDVRSFDVSPDAGRFVVGVGEGSDATVRVGNIIRTTKQDRVKSLSDSTAIDAAEGGWSPVWTNGVRIAFLGTNRVGTPSVLTVLVDGSSVTSGAGGRAVLPDLSARTVRVGSRTNADSYVTAGDGFLWHLGPGGTWQLVDADKPITSVGFGP